MNILLVSLGRDYGGADKVVESLFFYDYGKNVNMHIACLENTKISENVLNSEKRDNFCRVFNDKKKLFKSIRNIRKYIKEKDIDIIHTHSVSSELVGILGWAFTGCKIITTIHSRADFDTENKLKGNVYCFLQRKLVKFNKKYIVVSNELKDFLLKQKVNLNKLQVINNGIKPLDARKKNRCDHVFTLCSIGRLSPVKAHEKLIKALGILKRKGKKFKCIIAGEGELFYYLNNLVQVENLVENVEFIGFTSDVRDVFDKSDALVMQSNMEGMPMILLECMSYKIPVITNNVGGIKDLFDESNSIILNSNMPEEISDKISFAIDNKDILLKNAEKAYEKFKCYYDIEVFINSHLKVYNEVVLGGKLNDKSKD